MARRPAGLLPVLLAALWLAGCGLPTPIEGLDDEGLPELTTGQTWFGEGMAQLRAGEPARAKRYFYRSLRAEGSSARTMTGIGLANERMGLMTEAERWFLRAIEAAPTSELARNNLGVVYFRQGKYHQARREFRTALDLSEGQNSVAAANLALSDRRIAVAEAALAPDASVNTRLERRGTSEYLLTPIEPEPEPAGITETGP